VGKQITIYNLQFNLKYDLRKKKCQWVSVGEKRARPSRRDEGSGSSAQGMVLGVPQTRGSDFTIEHLEQGVYVLNRG